MENRKLVGRGRTADIYAWNEHQVLKVFKEWCSEDMVRYELRIAGITQAAGLPVPAVDNEMQMVDGRYGIIYERIDGPSMLTVLRLKPWLVRKMGRLMADLQVSIHKCCVPNLPLMTEYLERAIRAATNLQEQHRAQALDTLTRLPSGNVLCHGDFHPDNIIMTRRGPRVIDWITAVQGHPMADVARTELLLRMGDPPPGTPARWLINLLRATFFSSYLDRYLYTRAAMRQDVEAWMLPIAAARANENIAAEQTKLQALIQSLAG